MTHLAMGIIDSDAAFGRNLAKFLVDHDLPAEHHADGKPLLARLGSRPPRMILLGEGGDRAGTLQLLRRIRAASVVPCIVVSGSADELSQIIVMEAGADDLVDRGIPPRALLARIRAVLRRGEWGAVEHVAALSVGGWRVIPERRQLLRPDGSECPLTTAEFDLMHLLAESRGKPVTREIIALGVFRRPFRAEDRTVDNLVLRLRRKLGPAQQDSIRTIRGAGYLFAGFIGCAPDVAVA